jgi:hypothetical protein
MNVIEVTNRIKQIPLFKDLVLSEPNEDNHFGVIQVPKRHFKRNKNEIKLSGTYSLFVAHMYKNNNTMNEFFYLTFSNRGEQRDYRKHSFYPIEYNKIFASGDSVDKIISVLEMKLIGYELK